MEIAPHFILHETDHWIINHHLSSALPGYLMLSTKVQTTSLTQLSPDALAELGVLLARTQQIIEQQLLPKRLYIGRFGHEPGWPLHFHFIPVYQWVEDLFWDDARYRLLQNFVPLCRRGDQGVAWRFYLMGSIRKLKSRESTDP